MGFDSRAEARSYWIFLGIIILMFTFFSYQACRNQTIFSKKNNSSSSVSIPEVQEYKVHLFMEK